MPTYIIQDLAWSTGASEPARQALLAMEQEMIRLQNLNAELLAALKMGYTDTMDYIQCNNLCGSENNRWLVLARAAIAKAEGTQ